jgi:hypothetical protein
MVKIFGVLYPVVDMLGLAGEVQARDCKSLLLVLTINGHSSGDKASGFTKLQITIEAMRTTHF